MRLPPAPSAAAASVAARALSRTWRWRVSWAGPATDGPEGREEGAAGGGAPGGWRAVRPPAPLEAAVHALWHEHLLPLAVLHRGEGAVALVSRHRDGEILSRVLEGLGYRTARGSSTRGGGSGLREMIRAGRDGVPLAFTPDGPRGPARTCKPGVIRAAAATGLPVVPTAAAASSGRRLASWDGFLVPAPGATVCVSRGEPIAVPGSGEGGRRGPGAYGNDGPVATVGPELEAWCRRVEGAVEAERRRCEDAVRGRVGP